MTRKKDRWLLSFAILTLFAQSIVTVALFSQTNPDGGYWPFVLVVNTILDIFYSAFVLWLVQIRLSRARGTALATMALAVCVFLFGNFGLLFGAKGHAALVRVGVVEVPSSDVVVYLLYAVFAVIPMSIKLGTRVGRLGD